MWFWKNIMNINILLIMFPSDQRRPAMCRNWLREGVHRRHWTVKQLMLTILIYRFFYNCFNDIPYLSLVTSWHLSKNSFPRYSQTYICQHLLELAISIQSHLKYVHCEYYLTGPPIFKNQFIYYLWPDRG